MVTERAVPLQIQSYAIHIPLQKVFSHSLKFAILKFRWFYSTIDIERRILTHKTFTTFQKLEKVQMEMKPSLHLKYRKYENVKSKNKNLNNCLQKNAK